MPQLKVLHLNNNQIEKIEWYAFDNLKNLSELILDHNNLAAINVEFFDHDLSHLEKLGLAHNRITSIRPQAFKYLTQLRFLDLSHNMIILLDHKIFEPKSSIQFLDVTGNTFLKLVPAYKQRILNLMGERAIIKTDQN